MNGGIREGECRIQKLYRRGPIADSAAGRDSDQGVRGDLRRRGMRGVNQPAYLIRLRPDDVKTHHLGLVFHQGIQELGHTNPRPRPTPELIEGLLIDRHQGDLIGRGNLAPGEKAQVKGLQLQQR